MLLLAVGAADASGRATIVGAQQADDGSGTPTGNAVSSQRVVGPAPAGRTAREPRLTYHPYRNTYLLTWIEAHATRRADACSGAA